MAAAALALGLFFDRPIIEDLGLVDAVLELSLGGRRVADWIEVQTYMPLATGRLKKPARFNWPRLARTLAEGDVITFGVRSDTASGDARQVEFRLDCIALSNHERADFYNGRAHRFMGSLSFGQSVLAACDDVDGMVATIFDRLARHIALAAGVVVADASHEAALGIARCSGGMPGTELARRCGQLYGASFTWGPFAREPEWGTFLQRRHAEAIGGAAAIRAAVEPFALVEADDLVYVQVTPYAEALGVTATAKISALETLMRPVLDGPSTRRP